PYEPARRHRAGRRRDGDGGGGAERHRGHRDGGEAARTAEVMSATVFAPGSIGNCGPGFDVLRLAVEAAGDPVTVQLTDGAGLAPLDPHRNAAWLASTAWLRAHGDMRNAVVSIDKGLPVSGGLGGSAASSVGGAYAAALAMGIEHPEPLAVVAAALEGEVAV